MLNFEKEGYGKEKSKVESKASSNNKKVEEFYIPEFNAGDPIDNKNKLPGRDKVRKMLRKQYDNEDEIEYSQDNEEDVNNDVDIRENDENEDDEYTFNNNELDKMDDEDYNDIADENESYPNFYNKFVNNNIKTNKMI